MRVFVTGGSGFIGSAVVPELIANGHQVLALARSDASAAALRAAGAEVLRGDLEDLESLRKGAAEADAVIHLGFIHDFSRFAEVQQIDRRAVDTFGEVLEGTNKALSIASGVLVMNMPGEIATEGDTPRLDPAVFPRIGTSLAALEFAERGVRSSIVRLAPTVHGAGDHGFIPYIINVARERGVSAYIGDGANRWPAIHRLDAATLFRLAIEKAPPGSVLHGTAEEGIPAREIAEVIGKHLDVPVTSIPPEAAAEHFGWMAQFWALDQRSSNTLTRRMLGWNPVQPGLIDDLEARHYFETAAATG